MTTLTKYISKEYIKLFLFCQFIFFPLFLIIDIVQKMDNFIEKSDVIFLEIPEKPEAIAIDNSLKIPIK